MFSTGFLSQNHRPATLVPPPAPAATAALPAALRGLRPPGAGEQTGTTEEIRRCKKNTSYSFEMRKNNGFLRLLGRTFRKILGKELNSLVVIELNRKLLRLDI